jgi:hypothetical protein
MFVCQQRGVILFAQEYKIGVTFKTDNHAVGDDVAERNSAKVSNVGYYALFLCFSLR